MMEMMDESRGKRKNGAMKIADVSGDNRDYRENRENGKRDDEKGRSECERKKRR